MFKNLGEINKKVIAPRGEVSSGERIAYILMYVVLIGLFFYFID